MKEPELHVDSTAVSEVVFKAFESICDSKWDSIPGCPVASFKLKDASTLHEVLHKVELKLKSDVEVTLGINNGDYFIDGCELTGEKSKV